MGRADLHIHTRHGDGVDSIEAVLDYAESRTDLDVIAITEHDNLGVAHRARDLWARRGYRFDLVPGVEVTTLDGHVVALFVEEPVPFLRRVEETVEVVKRQGGVCFVPHPLSPLARSLGPKAFARVEAAGLRFDAIELASANPTTPLYLKRARRLNRERYALPWVGASDAHFVQAIGSAYTTFEGSTAGDLCAAFASGSTGGHADRFPSLREVGYTRALKVPLAGLVAMPRRLGWRRTARVYAARLAR